MTSVVNISECVCGMYDVLLLMELFFGVFCLFDFSFSLSFLLLSFFFHFSSSSSFLFFWGGGGGGGGGRQISQKMTISG